MRTMLSIAVGLVCLSGCAAREIAPPAVVGCPSEHIALDEGGEHKELWRIEHDRVEGLTVAKLRGERGYAVAFRRAHGITMGALTPGRSPAGPLVAVSRAAEQSTPILQGDGEGVLVAWSERDEASSPWHVRLARWVPGGALTVLDEQDAKSSPTLSWSSDGSGKALLRVDTPELASVMTTTVAR